jgi:putative PIN family toxin of toxin-antitoxin system
MRLVLDTNVVASGLLWGGVPEQFLDAAQAGEFELFTSKHLLAELAGILTRGKFAKALAATGLPREELVLGYAELATIVTPGPNAALVRLISARVPTRREREQYEQA